MGAYQNLRNMAGRWSGQKVLHDPESGADKVSAVEATLGATEGLVFEYRWAHDGRPISGRLQVRESTGYQGSWVDEWHMAEKPMALVGSETDAGLVLRGQFEVEGQEPWGWIIVLRPERDRLDVVMAGVTPDQAEFPAAELSLRRA